jgi:hypothetical protein
MVGAITIPVPTPPLLPGQTPVKYLVVEYAPRAEHATDAVAARIDKIIHRGPGRIDGGHIVGHVAWASVEAPGSYCALAIGGESKLDLVEGWINVAVAQENQLNSHTAEFCNVLILTNSHLVSALGRVGTVVGFNVQLSGIAGWIDEVIGLRLPTPEANVIGIGKYVAVQMPALGEKVHEKYLMDNADPTVEIRHAGPTMLKGPVGFGGAAPTPPLLPPPGGWTFEALVAALQAKGLIA